MEIIEYDGHKTKTYKIKMKKSDYFKLSIAVCEVLNSHKNIVKTYKDNNLTPMRFRWDLLHMSNFRTNDLYSYLNDNHIDTALRHIIKHIYD